MRGVYNGGFKTREAKIERTTVNLRPRHRKLDKIRLCGYFIEHDATRVIKPHNARRLVKALACRIITRSADNFKIVVELATKKSSSELMAVNVVVKAEKYLDKLALTLEEYKNNN